MREANQHLAPSNMLFILHFPQKKFIVLMWSKPQIALAMEPGCFGSRARRAENAVYVLQEVGAVQISPESHTQSLNSTRPREKESLRVRVLHCLSFTYSPLSEVNERLLVED